MNIGQVAKASAIPARMIRYSMQIGLIAKAGRTGAGYRVYSHALRFIRRGHDLGFTVERIAILLQLWRGRSNADGRAIALGHARDLKRRIAEMQAMVRVLEHLTSDYRGDGRPDCPVPDDMPEDSAASIETERARVLARNRQKPGADTPASARRRPSAAWRG